MRQRIEALSPEVGADGTTRCALVLCPELVRVVPRPHRPFQGWRYLSAADAPPDLAPGADGGEASLPPDMAEALATLGVLGR